MANPLIETILQQEMGLAITSIGQTTLKRALNKRMKALNVANEESYSHKLKSSKLEIKELIEEVVIPETWFFRDKRPFEVLFDQIAENRLKTKKDKFFRLLSAPCSTGEEAYSLAITMLRSGWPVEQFQVYAMDISSRSLGRAREARYTTNSFRGTDNSLQRDFFSPDGKDFLLKPFVREKVRFFQGNLLNAEFMQSLGVFDIIFCRNVLIYLDSHSRLRAIGALNRQLAPNGILFVGHAEVSLFNNSPFVPANFSQAFAFFKKERLNKQKTKAPVSRTVQAVPQNKASSPQATPNKFKKVKSEPVKEKAVEKQIPAELDTIQHLANQGHLKEASKKCEDYLKTHKSSAQGYFLLGVIRDAEEDYGNATKLLSKAVYLEPNHHEALVLLALLAEKSGDNKRAKAYNERIQRLQKRLNTKH